MNALRSRWLGAHPIGYLFVAPYVIFVLAIYGYPMCFALYMSFFDYFFASPGAAVERPFVGLQNYVNVLSDPMFHIAMAPCHSEPSSAWRTTFLM